MESESVEIPIMIRPFSGSIADAEGLLAVEKATFDESPYTAAEVQAMLVDGPQQAWLAVQQEHVAGFAIGFPATGLRGSWWEVDLLAVHPAWREHRLGCRLIEATLACGALVTRKARALVADDNSASEHAFRRAGFRVSPGARELFIFRPGEAARRQRSGWDGTVGEVAGRGKMADCLASYSVQERLAATLPDARVSMDGFGERWAKEPIFLVAEKTPGGGQRAQLAGYAELLEVQTLLYRGTWIESLVAVSTGAREALVERAVDRTCEADLDEIGAVVHEQDWAMQQALRRAGFRSLGGFRWLVAEMPGGPALP